LLLQEFADYDNEQLALEVQLVDYNKMGSGTDIPL
jgi:hypothetical protein